MLIKIKVFPKSRKEQLIDKGNNRYELHIRAEAKRGEANLRVIEILRAYFTDVRNLRIVKGHTTPNKHVEVDVGQGTLGLQNVSGV